MGQYNYKKKDKKKNKENIIKRKEKRLWLLDWKQLNRYIDRYYM